MLHNFQQRLLQGISLVLLLAINHVGDIDLAISANDPNHWMHPMIEFLKNHYDLSETIVIVATIIVMIRSESAILRREYEKRTEELANELREAQDNAVNRSADAQGIAFLCLKNVEKIEKELMELSNSVANMTRQT